MSALAAPYRFPLDMPWYSQTQKAIEKEDAAWLLVFVRRASELEDVGGGLFDYMKIRPIFCAASVLLNEMGVYPPRVRETRKAKPVPVTGKPSREQSYLSNDRQIIDIHWLHCTGQGQPEPRWAKLLGQDAFDFQLAAKFVLQVGEASNKADALHLTPFEEIQLAVIQTRPSADKWRNIVSGKQRTIVKVRTARTTTSSRLTEKTAKLLPDAYVAWRVAGPSATDAARALTVFTGRTATPDRLRSCRDWLKKQEILAPT